MIAGIKKLAPGIIMTNFVFILLAQTFITTDAEAIPAFARQTGNACTSCHSQHFPTLNGFGRMFKASGYTMVGSQKQVEGDGLSIPESINAALVGSAQGVSDDSGRAVGFPATLSLYLAGRAGEKLGFMFEMPFEKTEVMDENGAEAGMSSVAVANFGSFKTNYVDQFGGLNIGAHAFSTAMAGPAYGYELLSTGAMGMNVAQTGANAMGAIGLHMEHGATLMSQFMAVMDESASAMGMSMNMTMAGAATGFGASVQNSTGFIYAAAYTAQQQIDPIQSPVFGNYLRAAWTPYIAGFDIGAGIQSYFGEASNAAGGGNVVTAAATTADLQAQGELMGMPLGLYATYATAPKSEIGAMNHYNMSTGGDNSSIGALAELSLMKKLSVSVGYTSATYWTPSMKSSMGMEMGLKELKGTSTTIGTEYLFLPNVRFALRYASFGGASLDGSSLTGTIYAGL